MHGINADLVCTGSVKGNRKKGGRVFVMVFRMVIFHTGNTGNIFYLVLKSFAGGIGDIGYHHSGSAIGNEFVIHKRQALSGLRIFRQVSGDVIFYLDPVR